MLGNKFKFGASDAFDALVFGHTSPDTLNYLRNQSSMFETTLSEHGKRLMTKAREAVEFFNGSNAIDFARRVLTSSKVSSNIEYVKYLSSLEEMQKASNTMQRWVMANPNVRQMYFDQKLDGYYESFINIHGTDIKDTHYDYRRVMDGVIQITDDDYYYTEYFEDLLPGDRDLTFKEQIDIIHTWSNMDLILALGKDDPTSPDGGSL